MTVSRAEEGASGHNSGWVNEVQEPDWGMSSQGRTTLPANFEQLVREAGLTYGRKPTPVRV